MLRKISIGLTAIFLPLAVRAQDLGSGYLDKAAIKGAGYRGEKIEDIVGTVINAFLSVIGVIFLIYLVYGGYLWIISQGEKDTIDKAKSVLKTSLIGLIIVLAAYAITLFVYETIITEAVR